MALAAIMHGDDYTCYESITSIDPDSIQRSKAAFDRAVAKGIITDGSYDARVWTMTDQIGKANITVGIDDLWYTRHLAAEIGCAADVFGDAIRIAVTSKFGMSLETLRSIAKTYTDFASARKIPKDYARAQDLLDLLTILPGDAIGRTQIIYMLEDIPRPKQGEAPQRNLADYQTYFLFNHIFAQFWATANKQQRLLYFPLWCWWQITMIIPLRPTECTLIPRDCVTCEGDKWYITLRRTKLKGRVQSANYTIADDYELCRYQTTEDTGQTILEYIDGTVATYRSDIDTLFCAQTQLDSTAPGRRQGGHYTYNNLDQLLQYFYRTVILPQGYEVVTGALRLEGQQIGRIRLGDLRHIAMINLITSGGSPSVCRELAGHESVEISAHYYSNVTNFLDVLAYECCRQQPAVKCTTRLLDLDYVCPVQDGYCQSRGVRAGDYSDCCSAVDAYGHIGVCTVCQHYYTRRQAVGLKQEASEELRQTLLLLRQALETVGQGGTYEPLSCCLDRLQAQANNYIRRSATARRLEEEQHG